MKTTSGQKTKIGAFTFVGLLVLVLAIFLSGTEKTFLAQHLRYTAHLKMLMACR